MWETPRGAERVDRHQPERGLDAVDAGQRGRDADRAAPVGADGERTQARGHRGAGPAARAARSAVEVPRVAGGPEEQVVGGADPAHHRGVGLAELDRPRRLHPLHHRRALGGHVVREEPRAERGADAAGDHEILGGERHPVQRAQTRPLLAHRALRGAGRLHGVLGGQGHEGVQARVESLDAGQHRGHDLDGGDLAALDGGRHLGRGHPAEVVGSASHGKPPHPALPPGGEGCLVRRRAGADPACRGARRPAGSSRRRPG